MDSGLEDRYSFTPGSDSTLFIHCAMVSWVVVQWCREFKIGVMDLAK